MDTPEGVCCHFAESDNFCTQQVADKMEATLKGMNLFLDGAVSFL